MAQPAGEGQGEGRQVKAKKYTAAEWRRAMNWAQAFLGLKDWGCRLWWRTRPDWVPHDDIKLACSLSFRREKQVNIWVNIPECHTQQIDPYQALFHEYLHVAFEDVEIESDSDAVEFLLCCLEKAMLAAYRKGVK